MLPVPSLTFMPNWTNSKRDVRVTGFEVGLLDRHGVQMVKDRKFRPCLAKRRATEGCIRGPRARSSMGEQKNRRAPGGRWKVGCRIEGWLDDDEQWTDELRVRAPEL